MSKPPSLQQLAFSELQNIPFVMLQFVAVLGILSFVLMIQRGKPAAQRSGWLGYGWILGITGYLITALIAEFIQGPSKPYIRNDLLFMAGLLGGWSQVLIAYVWIFGARIQFTGSAYGLSSAIDMATVSVAGALVQRWIVPGALASLRPSKLVQTWLVRSAAGIGGIGMIALFDTGPPGDYALFAIRRVIGAPASFLLYLGIYWLFKVDAENRQRIETDRLGYEKRLEMQRDLALRDSEIRLVADNIPALVASWTREGRCLSVNREFCACFGVQDPTALVGASAPEIIGALNWERIRAGFEAAAAGERSSFDCELQLQQGPTRVGVTCIAEAGHEQRAGRVFLLIVNLEGRMRAEDALHHREQLLIAAMDSIAEALIMTDASGRISRMNPVAEKLTGWRSHEADGRRHETVFDCIAADDSIATGSLIDAALGEGRTCRLPNAMLVARDGSERLISAAAAPIAVESHQPLGAIVVFRDITEESLIRAELQRHDKLQAIGQLVSGVAHDFNNLLASIDGAARLETIGRQAGVADRKNLNIILTSTRRAADLVRRLTDFAGNRQTEFTPIDAGAVIRETVEMLERTTARTITIAFSEATAAGLAIVGNSAAIQSVLLNIAVNACHSMPDGGELRFACASLELGPGGASPLTLAPGAYVEIKVSDTGCGIAKENLDRVFDPFFTTKDRGFGTGLGLASAYGVVREHGGWIGIESSLGVGTTVRMLLPAWAGPGREPEPERAEAQVRHEGLILFVDDDPLFFDVGSSMLRALGYSVATARNGAQALEQYRRYGAQLQAIVIDLDMPVMGGRQAVTELRRLGAGCRIVMTTGRGDQDLRPGIAAPGIDAVLLKPFSFGEVQQALQPDKGIAA